MGIIFLWYARQDSNLRPSGSKPDTLIQLSYGRTITLLYYHILADCGSIFVKECVLFLMLAQYFYAYTRQDSKYRNYRAR